MNPITPRSNRDGLTRRTLLGGVLAVGAAGCASTTPGSSGSPTQASSSAATSAPPSVAASPSKKDLRSFTAVMSGDLLWHNTVWFSAADDHRRTGKGDQFDFDPMFAAMKPIISGADLAIAHEEVPFAPKGGPYKNYPMFAAPPQIAPWMATMGWNLATTVSNHCLDAGWEGLVRTHKLLNDNGIAVAGTYATQQQRDTPVIVSVKGVKVAVVSGVYSLNGLSTPPGKEFGVSMWDVANLKRQAARAKQAGADVVMAHLHGGEEYQAQPNADQVTRATALTADPNIDLVFGEHVHVVQPITKINGKWVVYGMGNMVAQHETSVPRGYEGITVRFGFTEKPEGGFEVTKAEYIPTVWNHYGGPDAPIRILPVVASLKKDGGNRARLNEALANTREAVHLLGKQPDLIEV